MARTTATVRRLTQVVIPQRIGNKNILNRHIRNTPFKIKHIPAIEVDQYQINRQVVR